MKRAAKNASVSEIEATAARWVARRDAGLSPSDAEELQRWIEADPRHRDALGFYDSAWLALAEPARQGASDALELQLAALSRQRQRRRVAAGTAACAVLLAIGMARWDRSSTTLDPGGSTALVLRPDRQTLPDGTEVDLKSSARVTVSYSATHRRVVLEQGEAYFSVQKDPARPFIVSAGNLEVRAVGTAFSVQMNPSAVEVLVTQGKVEVDKAAGPTPPVAPVSLGAPVALEAGKRVVVERAASMIDPPKVSAVPVTELEERLAWRNPRLEFTRTRLVEAVELLNLHAPASAPRLAVDDGDVAAMRITGVFRADNTDAFVMLLEGAFGVQAERVGNVISLRRVSAEPKPR